MTPPLALEFEVLGPPKPWQRAGRGVARNGRVVSYTPPETVAYQRAVRTAAWAKLVTAGVHGWPLDARYRVKIACYFANDRRRDIDNLSKSVLDALAATKKNLTGALYADDTQVVELSVLKLLDREHPRTLVRVEVVQP